MSRLTIDPDKSWCFHSSTQANHLELLLAWRLLVFSCNQTFNSIDEAHSHYWGLSVLLRVHLFKCYSLPKTPPQKHNKNAFWGNIWALWPSQVDTCKLPITLFDSQYGWLSTKRKVLRPPWHSCLYQLFNSLLKTKRRGWRGGSAVQSTQGLSQHSYQVAHSYLELKLQRVWCSFLASVGASAHTYMETHIDIHT